MGAELIHIQIYVIECINSAHKQSNKNYGVNKSICYSNEVNRLTTFANTFFFSFSSSSRPLLRLSGRREWPVHFTKKKIEKKKTLRFKHVKLYWLIICHIKIEFLNSSVNFPPAIVEPLSTLVCKVNRQHSQIHWIDPKSRYATGNGLALVGCSQRQRKTEHFFFRWLHISFEMLPK